MSPIDLDSFTAGLRRITSLDHELDVESTLHRLVDDISTLFDSAGAGLMMVDADGSLRYVAASSEDGRLLEQAQQRLGSGPCVDSLLNDRVVTTPDVVDDERWPELAEVLRPTSVRAVMGMPIHVASTAIGSLDVYDAHSHTWDATEAEALSRVNRVIEHLIGSALLAHHHDELVRQLQHALDSRVVIERAIGWTMARRAVSPAEAFNVLRQTARSRRMRVHEVAEEVLQESEEAAG